VAKELDALAAELAASEPNKPSGEALDIAATATATDADKGKKDGEEEDAEKSEVAEEEEGDEDTAIKDFLRDELGFEVDKYESGSEALRGAREKLKLALRKDEDAEYGRQLRPMIGGKESQILALLQGHSEPTPGKQTDGTGKDKVPEYDPAWRYQITTDAEGKWVPAPGADKDVVGKYRTYLEWRERQLDELVRNPEGLLEKFLADKSKEVETKARETTQAELASEREQLQVDAWQDKNAEKLFVDPSDPSSGLTPYGQLVSKRYIEEQKDGVHNRLRALAKAEEWANTQIQKTNGKVRKVPGHSVRQPAIAARSSDDANANLSVSELLDKFEKANPGRGFEKLVEYQNKQRLAAKAVD